MPSNLLRRKVQFQLVFGDALAVEVIANRLRNDLSVWCRLLDSGNYQIQLPGVPGVVDIVPGISCPDGLCNDETVRHVYGSKLVTVAVVGDASPPETRAKASCTVRSSSGEAFATVFAKIALIIVGVKCGASVLFISV